MGVDYRQRALRTRVEGEPDDIPPDPPVLWLRRPDRQRITPVPLYLDALLPDEHLARLIWAAVEQPDLSAFTAHLKVVEGGPGRAAADPAVLVAVWISATSQGESSARQIARLCPEHFAYLCNGNAAGCP